MRTLFLLLLLLPQEDERSRRFCEGIQFQKAEADSDEARRVVELLLQKKHWIGAHRLIEEKLGAWPEGIDLSVEFGLEGEEMGHAEGRGDKFRIVFNMKKLVDYMKLVDDIEKQKKAAQSEGKRLVYKVPPVKFERIIYHEMTHVFQRGCDAPNWFIEGMAQLIGDDPNSIYAFAAEGRPVKGLDQPLFDRNEIYARGHTFWKWLDSQGTVKKIAELCVVQHRPWKESVEEVTGLSWSGIVEIEREWSTKEIDHLRTKQGR